MEVLHHFFHSSENSCRKIKFTGGFPRKSYILHLLPSVNNWYKWTAVKIQRAPLFLWCSYNYISMERIKGVSGRSPPKNDFSSFSLFERKKTPQLISKAPNSAERTTEAWKLIVPFPLFFLTYTSVSSVPTNIHILKSNLVDVLQNTGTAV